MRCGAGRRAPAAPSSRRRPAGGVPHAGIPNTDQGHSPPGALALPGGETEPGPGRGAWTGPLAEGGRPGPARQGQRAERRSWAVRCRAAGPGVPSSRSGPAGADNPRPGCETRTQTLHCPPGDGEERRRQRRRERRSGPAGAGRGRRPAAPRPPRAGRSRRPSDRPAPPGPGPDEVVTCAEPDRNRRNRAPTVRSGRRPAKSGRRGPTGPAGRPLRRPERPGIVRHAGGGPPASSAGAESAEMVPAGAPEGPTDPSVSKREHFCGRVLPAGSGCDGPSAPPTMVPAYIRGRWCSGRDPG